VTSQAPVEKTRSVPDGDALPGSHTDSPDAITDSPGHRGPTDPPTVALTLGVDDAAVHGVDEVLGREVRLVTLPPASGEVLSERIEQVRHLARLHHPHLLEVYDVDGLAPDTESTLVLENVPGEPLAVVLREGPIAEPAVARMGAQLASALAHAHAHGVEHGAIGAASILVDHAHTEAWLVGLTASLSGPLPVIDPETDDDDGAARRRASDVRALAAVLGEILAHAAAVTGGDDPEAVTRPTDRERDAAASPLAALLQEVDAPEPPSAAAFSEQLARVGRGVAAHAVVEEPTRLVPVVASWPESPAAGFPVPPELSAAAALAAGPAVRARGAGGVTPVTVIGPAGRRARRAGVLGAATATLALASGLVIWAGESHPVRQEAQAEIGAATPSSVAPPLVPALEVGSPPGGGDGGTWTGGSGGFHHTAVGVASRKAALPEEPSRAALVSPDTSTSTARPPSTRPSSTRPSPTPTDPAGPTPTTRPRPTTSTPPRTTTRPPTTTTRPAARATPTTAVAPTTTAKATTTAKPTTSAATTTTVAPPTTTTSEQAVLAAGQ